VKIGVWKRGRERVRVRRVVSADRGEGRGQGVMREIVDGGRGRRRVDGYRIVVALHRVYSTGNQSMEYKCEGSTIGRAPYQAEVVFQRHHQSTLADNFLRIAL
jgi:hypothetical protein